MPEPAQPAVRRLPREPSGTCGAGAKAYCRRVGGSREYGALAGVRVLDLSRVLAGPYCTMVLGDYGADVIKVEEPGSGDSTRRWGPPWVGDQSAYYLSANRNKRAITVNLKSAAGHRHSCSGWPPSAMWSSRTSSRVRPPAWALTMPRSRPPTQRLVYCSLTGYGQTGPYHDRPGYDFVIQAQGGIMSITGPRRRTVQGRRRHCRYHDRAVCGHRDPGGAPRARAKRQGPVDRRGLAWMPRSPGWPMSPTTTWPRANARRATATRTPVSCPMRPFRPMTAPLPSRSAPTSNIARSA